VKAINIKNFIFLFFLIFISGKIFSQNKGLTIVKGNVADAETGEPLAFANVTFENSSISTKTNPDGNYQITTKETFNKIKISCVGFKTETKSISPGKIQLANIKMHSETKTLKEMVVKPPKKRYKNKDNPAVELMDNVIKHKTSNHLEDADYVEYEKYEKDFFALSNINEKFKHQKLLKNFIFIFNNIDTTKIIGKAVLPVYIRESLMDCYSRKTPKAHKEIEKGTKMVSFKEYLDDQGLVNMLKYLYMDVDIYDNNVSLLTNQFLSPIAPTAPLFYKYFIIDTSLVDNEKCVKVYYSPRNRTDLLFQGNMYISLDSSYAVKKIEISVNKYINLNWIKDLSIVQTFDKEQNQGWKLTTDDMSIDFGIMNQKKGVFGERFVSYKNFIFNTPRKDSIYEGEKEIHKPDAEVHDDAYWDNHRHEALSKTEQGVYKTMDSIKKMPKFKRSMNLILFLSTGYIKSGDFDIGPFNSFTSYNPIEGYRVRFGGRTNTNFSKKINFDGYVTYGFLDQRYKYSLGTTYSFTKKSIYEFPVKSLRLSYTYDTRIPGQELQYVQDDNFFLSFKRGVNNKFLYNKTFKIEHLNEFKNHFSYTLGFQYAQQEPTGKLFYNTNDYSQQLNTVKYLTISKFYLNLRIAPHEKFYQGKTYRAIVPSSYPIIQLMYSVGIKNLLNDDYNFQNIGANIQKRFLLGMFGYTYVTLEAQEVLGKVPFPLLLISHANQTYTYQAQSYNLMNFLEFVSDKYVTLYIDHYFNGAIFNKIPLLKRLKWREVVTGKILYGSLSNQNNPKYQNDLFRFPVDANNNPTTFTLDKQPYIEVSAGIANIFKFFRIDLVKRLTYLNNPNVSSIGIRIKIKMDF